MSCTSSSPFSLNLILPNTTRTSTHSSTFKLFCSNQIETQTNKKTQRKPRPSFSDQVLKKWSKKHVTSLETKFPWQKKQVVDDKRGLNESSNSVEGDSVSYDDVRSVKVAPWVKKIRPQIKSFDFDGEGGEFDGLSESGDSVVSDSVKFAPWVKRNEAQKKNFDFDHGNLQKDSVGGENEGGLVLTESGKGSDSVVSDSVKVAPWVRKSEAQKKSFDFDSGNLQKDSGIGEFDTESGIVGDSVVSDSARFAPWVKKTEAWKKSFDFDNGKLQKDSFRGETDGEFVNSLLSDSFSDDESERSESVPWERGKDFFQSSSNTPLAESGIVGDSVVSDSARFAPWVKKTEAWKKSFDFDNGKLQKDSFRGETDGEFVNSLLSDSFSDDESERSESVPWERGKDFFQSSSNTPLAEKMIPDLELKRLRNKAGRMVERFRVGAAGVTQELVDSIHEKWKIDEVVKLKFKGPSTLNMKRIHESLESRTGGIVIWRSGSSVVLFRGMTYKLPCVQSFTEYKSKNTENESSNHYAGRYVKDLTEKELLDLEELNLVLDGLGPRFKDWSGREPFPIDADLLPSLVEGYRRPYRLLPYGTKPGLRDKEMTFFRRIARTMPPHFALGRNRDLQGLAVAMVKLWERSAIAKIAIKRGVHNTCNERMAEELKRLTGGTLVSRNKDYIVFYRGNDFLPPNVTRTLNEAQDLSINRQEDEDNAREKASTFIDLTTKNTVKGPLIAGTLAETLAATSRWGTEPSAEEIEKMRRDAAVARHSSLVKLLEKKLSLANSKIKKAEKALAKVQEYLLPSQLPTDLETLTDEERFSLRKIGLSMKPFLELGRRGVFDGTIENMHLHWKYRELVKIMVERKSFAQVKHVAISLEAESGGVLVSVDKTTKGHVILVYRGKNYERPGAIRPKNLLTRRKALARAIELQRREALKYHIWELSERIKKLKYELEDMKIIDEIDEETLRSRIEDDSGSESESDSDDRGGMPEDEEAYLETYEHDDPMHVYPHESR